MVVSQNVQAVEAGDIDIYGPVACIELVRLMLPMAATYDSVVDQLDLRSAFLRDVLLEGDHT